MVRWAVTWLALSGLAGIIASNKGLSGLGYFFLSVVLSPLVGIIAALVARPNRAAVEETAIASGDSKKCPFCAELIRQEAVKCRYCGSDLASESPAVIDLGNLRCKLCGMRSSNYPSAHDHAQSTHGLAGRAGDDSIEEV
jgi:hypothetical protein